MQATLFEEKERAQVTLDSIGDGVITTDHQGYVKYLNPVAEELTGWAKKEACDQPIENVLHMIDEISREPISNPVKRCLEDGTTVGLTSQTILVKRDSTEFVVGDSAAPIRNREGQVIGVVLVLHDITESWRLQRQMAYDATHDALTGLINRREFERRLERCLTSARHQGLQHTLCYLDLDQFKLINDTVGHVAGDEMLKQVSQLLIDLLSDRDTLARLGGDEFGLLMENCPTEKAIDLINKIIDQISNYQFTWEGQIFRGSVSIGVVSISEQTLSIAQTWSEADVACYTAKDLGRNRYHVYQTEDRETAQRHAEILLAVQLQDAIDKDHFQLYCQPVVPLIEDQSHILYYELLLRLRSDDEQVISPNTFIPSAERYGLMSAIDRWVIKTAFSTLTDKSRDKGLRLAINLSGNSLNDETLLDFVREQFNEFSISPKWICFEITETAAIQNLINAQHFISEIRKLGAQIALDDFGSGLSSFRYLRTLSLDFLKIDGSFVKDMLESQYDKALVAAIHRVGHTMGIKTVAEHVEQEEIIRHLQEIGVDYAQGYALGHPIPFDDI